MKNPTPHVRVWNDLLIGKLVSGTSGSRPMYRSQLFCVFGQPEPTQSPSPLRGANKSSKCFYQCIESRIHLHGCQGLLPFSVRQLFLLFVRFFLKITNIHYIVNSSVERGTLKVKCPKQEYSVGSSKCSDLTTSYCTGFSISSVCNHGNRTEGVAASIGLSQ